MAINNISGIQPRIPQKVVSENIVSAQAQAVGPQDSVGIQSKTEPRKGLAPNSRLSDLKPEQLRSLGGGAALESIAGSQPDTTVGEIGPLLRNKPALESVASLMQHRNDLKVGDFVTQDKKGNMRIDPSYKDPETMEMLKERNDITPSEISSMRQNFTKTLKDPNLGKDATKKSFELLKKRPDLKPEDMGTLMTSLRQSAGGDDKSKQGGGADDKAGAAAALDMFDSASKLMQNRTDLKPDRVGEMAKSVGKLGSPEDKNGPSNVAEAFDSASKSLTGNALRKPEELSKTAATVSEHMQGGDDKTAGHRMNAFKKSAEMMGENTQMDHNSINKVLTQATERDPKIKNGEGAGKAKRLASVMDDVSTGVKQGTVAPTDLSSHFRNQDAEKARFQSEPKKDKNQNKTEDKSKEKPDKAEQKPGEGTVAANKPAEKSPATREVKPEEEGAKPALKPGESPGVTAQTAASAGPGEAAGTASAGVSPGTTPKTKAAGGTSPGSVASSPIANPGKSQG